MANLAQKDGIYLIRFRYITKEYKRSLKTRSEADAEAAKRSVEQTIHRLLTGFLQVPLGVSAADYILSGGTLTTPVEPVPLKVIPTTRGLIGEYLDSQRNKIAPSYLASQKLHLGHLEKFLETLADAPCDQVVHRDLDRFLQLRLAERASNTAKLERITLLQLYRWAVRQDYLATSPAAALPAIKGGSDRPPFRTLAEVQRILERGGLSEAEQLDAWECLYLAPSDIASLLMRIRDNAQDELGYLLHAVAAYTGMRRGEILRLRWIDLDLVDGYITARSRKQSRKLQETHRRIDLHFELRQLLEDWRYRRP